MCSRCQLHGYRFYTSGAQRIRNLDKSITLFYPGRLTTAPTQVVMEWDTVHVLCWEAVAGYALTLVTMLPNPPQEN